MGAVFKILSPFFLLLNCVAEISASQHAPAKDERTEEGFPSPPQSISSCSPIIVPVPISATLSRFVHASLAHCTSSRAQSFDCCHRKTPFRYPHGRIFSCQAARGYTPSLIYSTLFSFLSNEQFVNSQSAKVERCPPIYHSTLFTDLNRIIFSSLKTSSTLYSTLFYILETGIYNFS